MKYSVFCIGYVVMIVISSVHCDPPSPVLLQSKYSQDFNELPKTGTTSPFVQGGTILGWWSNQEDIIVSEGSSNVGGLYSFGETGSTDRALGAVTSIKKKKINFGVSLYSDHTVVKDIKLSFVGEQWRNGGDVPDTSSLLFDYVVMDKYQYANGGWGASGDTKLWSPGVSFEGNITVGNKSGPVRFRQSCVYVIKAPDMGTGKILQLRWTSHNGHDGLAIDDLLIEANFGPNTDASVIPHDLETTRIAVYVLAGFSGVCLVALAVVTAKWRKSVHDNRYFPVENGGVGDGGDGVGDLRGKYGPGMAPYIERSARLLNNNSNNSNMETKPLITDNINSYDHPTNQSMDNDDDEDQQCKDEHCEACGQSVPPDAQPAFF